MQVREVMSEKPRVLPADASIRDAALRMREIAVGAIPVARDDRLIGMITDRDIAVRAVADAKSPQGSVSDILTDEVFYCFEDDDVISVLENMHEQHVQRLVVLNNERDKDLVGMVSVADIADHCEDAEMAEAIARSCSHYH